MESNLCERFVELVESCGPVTCVRSATSMTFRGPRRDFAGARRTPLGLTGYLGLRRVVHDPRFGGATRYTDRLFVHRFHLRGCEELDEEFAGWVREAYLVGSS
ncbi:hypothetical protein [Nonomuraea sp. bgisy101]|uniref:hypothetical protein n=1 Tax=Nonomuraea sp. bgisy101 TaxID=3413784 RepID=UPI003D7199AB